MTIRDRWTTVGCLVSLGAAVVAFFWEKTVSVLSTTIAKFTILHHLLSIGNKIINVEGFGMSGEETSPKTPLIILMVMITVFSALSIRILNRKEIS